MRPSHELIEAALRLAETLPQDGLSRRMLRTLVPTEDLLRFEDAARTLKRRRADLKRRLEQGAPSRE